MSHDLHTLSVVIPMHNEAGNVDELLAEIATVKAHLPELTEAVLVDDNSNDGTLDKLKAARLLYPWLRVLSLSLTTGKGTAQWYGVRAASTELIIVLDGDRQNDPADIPKCLQAYTDALAATGKSVFVIGQRMRRNDNIIRRISSKVANSVRQKMLKDNTRDSGCAVRLSRREDYLSLPFFRHMHRFLSALALQSGIDIVLVDVGHRARVSGVAKYGVWNRLIPGIVDLFGMMWLGLRRRSVAAHHDLLKDLTDVSSYAPKPDRCRNLDRCRLFWPGAVFRPVFRAMAGL